MWPVKVFRLAREFNIEIHVGKIMWSNDGKISIFDNLFKSFFPLLFITKYMWTVFYFYYGQNWIEVKIELNILVMFLLMSLSGWLQLPTQDNFRKLTRTDGRPAKPWQHRTAAREGPQDHQGAPWYLWCTWGVARLQVHTGSEGSRVVWIMLGKHYRGLFTCDVILRCGQAKRVGTRLYWFLDNTANNNYQFPLCYIVLTFEKH